MVRTRDCGFVCLSIGLTFLARARLARAGDLEVFNDGTVSIRARSDVIREDPVPLFHNGMRVDDPRTPEADRYDGLEIFDHVPGTDRFPLTWTDLIGNTFLRATYQRSDGTTGRLGTSVVGSPSFRVPGGGSGQFRFIPEVSVAEVDTGLPEDERIRVTLSADFDAEASVQSVRSHPDPAIGETRSGLWLEFIARQDIPLDPDQLGNDAFRFMTISSMFSTATVYDANVLRWEDGSGRIRTFRLSGLTPRGRHLLPRATEIGGWLELVKEPGSTWFPDSPTIRIDIEGGEPLTRQLAIQGFLATSRDPNEDSLSVWLEWVDVPNPIPAGAMAVLGLTITAGPPRDVSDPCPADLDDSGFVDFADVLAVLTAWGECPGCPEDLDGSSVVDFGDVLVVLTAWGPCEQS